VLVFSFILSLSLSACKDGGGGDSGGNGGGGATIVTNSDGSSAISDVQVKDTTNITNTSISAAALPNYTGTLDFGYLSGGSNVDIFTDIAPGSSVKVTNGKLNMTLGNVTGGNLKNASYFFSDGSGSSNVTITPSDTKGYVIFDTAFRTSDVTYMLICGKKMTTTSQERATLCYVDKDCTVTGNIKGESEFGTSNDPVNCTLKKGWNYLIWNYSGSTTKWSSSQTLPSGYYWVVAKSDW
jgi:hypothetical protein